MRSWERLSLGEISDTCLGKMLDEEKNKGELKPYLANINVRWGSFFLNNLSQMRFEDYEDERYGLRNGDLIICEGGEPGRCAIWRDQIPNMKIQKALHRLRVKPGYNVEFLYYRMLLAGRLKELDKFFIGSTIKHLTGVTLRQIEFNFPNELEQTKISSVLSAIDAKIELNNRINAELEAMAKTLYDYWFVQFDFPFDFAQNKPAANGKPYKSSGGKMVYNPILKREIPEGWTEGTLEDLGQIVGGSTPTTTEAENFCIDGTPWITPNDLSGNQGKKFVTRGATDVSEAGIKSASLNKYPKGTVLLSSRAPIGYMAIARNELTTNQGFKSFIPNKGYSSAFIYYTVNLSLKAITQYASGSTFKEVSGSVLKTVKIVLPPTHISETYTAAVSAIFARQDTLEQENEKLVALRDWLLPMLMNGQVTVQSVATD
ncbi:restriction endonuclease subunit S [Methylomonas sp. YC3]